MRRLLASLAPSLLPSLLIFHPLRFATAEPIPVANPVAIAAPKAAPVAEAFPLPTPEPEALPLPYALPEPAPDAGAEQFEARYANAQNNYYAFSGAIYIVGANGQALNAASPAYCPNQAPQGCGNIGVWNWCCPSGNTCAWASSDHSVVGCCPNGYTCSGSVDRGQIQTVTVYITTTVGSHPTTVYQGGGGGGGVFVGPPASASTIVVAGGGAFVGQSTRTVQYNGYCSTLYANGPNLPTTAAGPCGTILVLNNAPGRSAVGVVLKAMLGLYGVLGFIGVLGFGGRRWW